MSTPAHDLPGPAAAPDATARRVTVHAARVRPSTPVHVTPSMAAHMAVNPPVPDDLGPALHFDLPTVAPADPAGPASVEPTVEPTVEVGMHVADVDTNITTAGAAPQRWWHRLLFWRRPSRARTGCRLCSWDGEGTCPLGHRA